MNGVVVTGMGCVSPVGNEVSTTWKAMVEGRSGIGRITQFDSADLPVHVAGEVKDFDAADRLGPKQARRMSRFSQFAVVVSEEALTDAALDLAQTDRDRVGVLIASGVGGLREIEQANHILENQGHRRVSPFVVPMMIGSSRPQLRTRLGVRVWRPRHRRSGRDHPPR